MRTTSLNISIILHLIFSQDDFIAFNRFFDSCIEMQDARQRIREVFYSRLNAKAEVMQNKVVTITNLDTLEGQKERDRVIKLINNEMIVFDPNEPKD